MSFRRKEEGQRVRVKKRVRESVRNRASELDRKEEGQRVRVKKRVRESVRNRTSEFERKGEGRLRGNYLGKERSVFEGLGGESLWKAVSLTECERSGRTSNERG
jgi:predicted DNA-binding antitoxin AbrB/MazE fold protein